MDQPFLRNFTLISRILSQVFPRRIRILSGIFIAGFFLSSCSVSTPPAPTTTPTLPHTATFLPLPTVAPTPLPLGIESNPLVLGIVSENNDPEALAAADQITKSIQQLTGYVIISRSYLSYSLLVSDMSAGKVHIAFLPPLTYLYARQYGFASVVMLTNHFGVYEYGSRFYANAASQFESFYDPFTDQSTADAAVALPQFQGKRPCWIDSTSASGYILPLGILKSKNIDVVDGAFLTSPVGVIRALYITGICDFGVTFTTTGDPRTSSAVAQDLTDVMNRVVVIWQSDPIIPNLNLSFHPSIKSDMQDDLIFGFKDLLQTETGKTALSTATNYAILDLKQVDDSIYNPFREIVGQTGIDLLSLVGR